MSSDSAKRLAEIIKGNLRDRRYDGIVDHFAETVPEEHVVTRINDHYYLCQCGEAGSERWAILHQFPFSGGGQP